MGINLGSGFGNLTGNTSNNAPTGGVLNLNKNDILDLTKRNPGLKRVMLGAGWDISNNGSDFDLDIAAFLLDANNKFNTVSNVIFFNNKVGQGISLAGDNRTGAGAGDDETINIELDKKFELNDIIELLKNSPNVIVQNETENNIYPIATKASGCDQVFVGRIRRDFSVDNGLNLWVVADNIRKGAATNAIQIVEKLIEFDN